MSFAQDMVAGEYHLDVLGISLQGSEKTKKKKIALVSPNEKDGRKQRFEWTAATGNPCQNGGRHQAPGSFKFQPGGQTFKNSFRTLDRESNALKD